MTHLLVEMIKVEVFPRKPVEVRGDLLPIHPEVDQKVLQRFHLNDNDIPSLGGSL
ncbi:hypothetical protein D3C73_1652760 [compost metagenome]